MRWDTEPNGVGKLATARSPDLVLLSFAYDAYGRSTGYTERIGSTDYTASVLYDSEGKVRELRYPSIDATATPGLTLNYTYNAADYLEEIGYTATAIPYKTLWHIDSRNADGRLLNGHYGNGLDAVRTYFPRWDGFGRTSQEGERSSP